MTPSTTRPSARDPFAELNADFAAALGRAPAHLADGARTAAADALVVCGLLGGKDVGKSTLINALAGREISREREEVGPGTSRPVAYVHVDDRRGLSDRLADQGALAKLEFAAHQLDSLRSIVLVDFPDFDSEFESHRAIVSAIAPLLDRLIWVMTPRKIADREWVAMTRRALQAQPNIRCVLNKLDELLGDLDALSETGAAPADVRAARFIDREREWFSGGLRSTGLIAEPGQCFLLSAKYPDSAGFAARIAYVWNDADWRTYGSDRDAVNEIGRLAERELRRLRDDVLAPCSPAEVERVKRSNLDAESRINAARIETHFRVDELLDQYASLDDAAYGQRIMNEAFGPGYCAAVAAVVGSRIRDDAGLADDLLERRVEHWPLLRLAHWPLGWSARLASRLAAARSERTAGHGLDATVVDGQTLTNRIGLLRSRLCADFPAGSPDSADRMPSHDTIARRAALAIDALPRQLERELLEVAWPASRRPSWLARGGLLLLALWFPLLQPIAEAFLRIGGRISPMSLWQLAYQVVAALSAPRLLAAAAMIAGVLAVALAWLHARGRRTVKTLGAERLSPIRVGERVDEILAREVMAPLLTPLHDRQSRIRALSARLDATRRAEIVEPAPRN